MRIWKAGSKLGRNIGFDMDEDDLVEMEQCHGVVAASAIFGNFDGINDLTNISDYSKEKFLWRKNASFAISKHYRRFDVFVEAKANKPARKYENASIDFQIDFYKNEGLTPYTEAKLPIISDVPEGCVIVRDHVPISDLFTCL
ncbi:hypothetical protein glysoja_048417 [Glycine soja]|uniref:TOD1/MUCI70 glycosyltransferase-like domain-containing protein n=1 Tax=Glycine soja TaxID=3848 RepID=A0A0B2RS83_GLYSO|nr:hypothetical protein glysoja_048417 [Glycine soja]